MKLSVIIPVLNEAKTIGRLLEFLLENAGSKDVEIIVVDGNSSDETPEIVSNYPVRLLQSPQGRAVQMNVGAREAKGEILYFVHADTLPPASFYEDLVSQIKLGYIIGCYRFKFESSQVLLKINSWFTRFDKMWLRGGDQTLFVLKTVFETLGGYDEQFVIMEEYDFIFRAKKLGAFKIIPKNVLVSARKYEKNSWLKIQLANLKAIRMFKKRCDPKQIKSMYQQKLRLD